MDSDRKNVPPQEEPVEILIFNMSGLDLEPANDSVSPRFSKKEMPGASLGPEPSKLKGRESRKQALRFDLSQDQKLDSPNPRLVSPRNPSMVGLTPASTNKRSSSLNQDGRSQLPTCGSVSTISSPKENQDFSNTSVFPSPSKIGKIDNFSDIRRSDWVNLLFISVSLAVLSPLGVLAADSTVAGLVVTGLLSSFSVTAAVLGLVKFYLWRTGLRNGYTEIQGSIQNSPQTSPVRTVQQNMYNRDPENLQDVY